MRKALLILVLSLFVLPAGQAIAENQYVSDQLTITMRTGQGDQYRIIKMLKAGAPVEILQEGTKGYLFVRTNDGTEGWVQKQFLTTDTPKPVVINRLEKEREKLREQLQQKKTQVAELTSELETARKDQKELERVRAEFADLQSKSAGVLELTAERDRLEARSIRLSDEVEQLREENENILFTGAVKWFLAGGGVLLTGWVIGKTSRKKKGFSY